MKVSKWLHYISIYFWHLIAILQILFASIKISFIYYQKLLLSFTYIFHCTPLFFIHFLFFLFIIFSITIFFSTYNTYFYRQINIHIYSYIFFLLSIKYIHEKSDRIIASVQSRGGVKESGEDMPLRNTQTQTYKHKFPLSTTFHTGYFILLERRVSNIT